MVNFDEEVFRAYYEHKIKSFIKEELSNNLIKGNIFEFDIEKFLMHFPDACEVNDLIIERPKEIEEIILDIFKEAYDMYWKMSCWKDGLIASNVGIHLMHDATEGGVWNALVEIATVTKKELRIYEDKLFINRAVKEVTSLVNIDPWSSISEGTMIIISDKGEKIVEALKREGIESAIVGEVKEGDGVTLVKKDGSKQRIEKPAEDPFWRVFFELSKKA